MATRTQILVKGIVQGVGFRPFVYSLAKRRGLRGCVRNNESGVLIDLEGEHEAIDIFVRDLSSEPPVLSNIESIVRQEVANIDKFEDFQILPSNRAAAARTPVPADMSVCDDCLRELFDPKDWRYRYPFINCTNCGPRFTLIESVPYDRERTTMREFTMCTACRSEYEDPADRRFHAETIACAECGPQVRLMYADGRVDGTEDPVAGTRRSLAGGAIVAIKGIGGYHLACDASNRDAVAKLRSRKVREDKPFAMMAATIDIIERYCDVSGLERELLMSRERPIVLLTKRADPTLPDEIAPGVGTLGFMLPYTPLHYLLFEDLETPLAMTSGNLSDEPIAYDDEEAKQRLERIADCFLTNDRQINIRTDDSIVRSLDLRRRATAVVVRRARGFAPKPIRSSIKFERPILACGAELKNTFCLASGLDAYLSHHIGDLENLEALRSFSEGIEHYKRLYEIEPEIVAFDLHPEYLSTKYAQAYDGKVEKIAIQHHHAHIASCMVDNNVAAELIGVAMDGLGFGTDGKIWGGEFLVADHAAAERVAHLEYVPMPGGVKAIEGPWRMAAAYLEKSFRSDFSELEIEFNERLDRAAWKTLRSMIRAGVNCPETSSMGRLFDAVSAILCLRSTINYEGQAAIALEHIADKTITTGYEFEVESDGTIKSGALIRHVVDDLLNGIDPSVISARFHIAVADLIANIATHLRDRRKLNRVALSGGVFQNKFLIETAYLQLKKRGFDVFVHTRVPTNDGGISLGQAAIANARSHRGST